MQNASLVLSKGIYDVSPFSFITTTSPGAMSLINRAPINSNALVSDDKT